MDGHERGFSSSSISAPRIPSPEIPEGSSIYIMVEPFVQTDGLYGEIKPGPINPAHPNIEDQYAHATITMHNGWQFHARLKRFNDQDERHNDGTQEYRCLIVRKNMLNLASVLARVTPIPHPTPSPSGYISRVSYIGPNHSFTVKGHLYETKTNSADFLYNGRMY